MTNRKKFLLAMIAAALMMATTSAANAKENENECKGTKMTAPLVAANDSGVSGSAQLCITSTGTTAQVRAKNLTAGNAYTMWFIYFDEPSKCLEPGACSDNDVVLPSEDPEGAFGRYDSQTASTKSVSFAGHSGVVPSPGSVITIELNNHGVLASDGKHRARQLLTPQIPVLGAPGLGTELDGTVGLPAAVVQFTIPVN